MKDWVQRLPGMKQGKVYIVPTQNGLIFLAGTAVVIIAGATYNNNLVFLLGFFLFAIFVISMVETHNNLRDLGIEALPIGDQHAGEPVSIPLRLINAGYSRRQMIELSPLKKDLVYGQVLCIEDVASNQPVVRNLVCGPMPRGVHQVPAVSLSTVFPLGLFRAWKVLRAEGEFFSTQTRREIFPCVWLPRRTSFLNQKPLPDISEEMNFANTASMNPAKATIGWIGKFLPAGDA